MVSIRHGRAIAVTVALLLTACDLGDVTDHRAASDGAPLISSVSQTSFATGFEQYPLGQLLHEADWTRIQRWPSGGTPILGDWRVKSVPGSLNGRAVQLENPPATDQDERAIQWDAPPILQPPLDIVTHLWIPPAANHPRVGVAWFIQQPDETGRLNGFALVRNALGSVNNGFFIVRYFDNFASGIWFGALNDGLEGGAWVWIHVSHTISGPDGTIRYRVWQGARADEPTVWDHEETSNWFGPDGGTPGPAITGKAGLFAAGHADMANAELYWDYFATDVVPACPDTVQKIIGEYATFNVTFRPTCAAFDSTGGSTHFSWSELNGGWQRGNPHRPWGLVTTGLTTGLEATRTNYNRGAILLTSGYRCPHGNAAVGGVPQSLHMQGRAGDMYSADHGGLNWKKPEFELLKAAADATVPRPMESFKWSMYKDHHYHAAW